MGKKQLINKL